MTQKKDIAYSFHFGETMYEWTVRKTDSDRCFLIKSQGQLPVNIIASNRGGKGWEMMNNDFIIHVYDRNDIFCLSIVCITQLSESSLSLVNTVNRKKKKRFSHLTCQTIGRCVRRPDSNWNEAPYYCYLLLTILTTSVTSAVPTLYLLLLLLLLLILLLLRLLILLLLRLAYLPGRRRPKNQASYTLILTLGKVA